MRTRIILYHDDADGKAAAAIAARWDQQRPQDGELSVVCAAVNYGEPVPWRFVEKYRLGPYDSLWLVDFSYPLEEMKQLLTAFQERLLWFDHHVSALEKLKELEQAAIAGTRSIEHAACMLVWNWCNPGQEPPLAVEYIADRDVWRFAFGDRTRWFYEKYLMEKETYPLSPIWDTFFEMDELDYQEYIAEGRLLYEARRGQLMATAIRLGYECKMVPRVWHPVPLSEGEMHPDLCPEIQNGLRVLKVNYPGSGDMGEVIRLMGFDIAWCYHEEYRDGKLVRVNSLYSDKVDVSEIAKAHDGGGHKGAAGFVERLL